MIKKSNRLNVGQMIDRLTEFAITFGRETPVVIIANGYFDIDMIFDDDRYDHNANDFGGDDLKKIVISFNEDGNSNFIKPYDTQKAKRKSKKLFPQLNASSGTADEKK